MGQMHEIFRGIGDIKRNSGRRWLNVSDGSVDGQFNNYPQIPVLPELQFANQPGGGSYSRRQVLKLSATAAVGVFLAACGAPAAQAPAPPTAPSSDQVPPTATLQPPIKDLPQSAEQRNQAFVDTLKAMTGISSSMTRQQIFERGFEITRNPNWIANQPQIMTMVNSAGQDIVVEIQSNGELKFTLPQKYPETARYPGTENQPPLVLTFTDVYGGKRTDNYLLVYGNSAAQQVFNTAGNRIAFQNFLSGYFRDMPTRYRLLHLVMSDSNQVIQFIDPTLIKKPIVPSLTQEGMGGNGLLPGSIQEGQVNIVIYADRVHRTAQRWHMALQQVLTNVLANEIIDVQIKALDPNRTRIPDTPGSIISLAAMFDNPLADKIIGSIDRSSFTSLVTSQMSKIVP